MIAVFVDCGCRQGMLDRMREPEACRDDLSAAIVDPERLPDLHPKIAHVYRRKAERLAEEIVDLRDRDDAEDAIRGQIKGDILTPGNRLSAILE